ncbi:protein ABHD13-like [Gigantopelta aegis]|uniref:protein ABHD13-like n=1 Tax=Gigantopelta aegis TaxID=1735272 RepID=UPI001B88D488|nr:protein ABHD13-like [Gigantopelta aegis]
MSSEQTESETEDKIKIKMPVKTSVIGSGFATIELVSSLVMAVLSRFWKLSSTALLIILLVFWFEGGLGASFMLILAVFGLFYYSQDMLLYHPDEPPHSRLYVEMPNSLNLPYDSQYTRTRDGTSINLVLVKHTAPGAPTIIYFHGNAGNVGHRLMNMFGLYQTCGCNVLMVEYRGFGKSDGSPTEHGLYQDAEAAMDFLFKRSDIDKKKIFIFGRSLGGAVAIHLVAQPYYASLVAGLILENTFTSVPEIAKSLFNLAFLKYVPTWCFKNQFQSLKLIPRIRLPTLFLSGLGDQLVPPRMMKDMYEHSGSSLKQFSQFEQGTHNETWTCPGYYETILKFVKEVLSRGPEDASSSRVENSISVNIDTKGIKTV